MFEKEAKSYAESFEKEYHTAYGACLDSFRDGAEFGYNKAMANEWHKVADGDLPIDDRIVSDQEGNNVRYVKHRNNWFYRHRTCEADVIAWCEIPKYTGK